MTESPKTGREVSEQRVRRGPAVLARVVRSLASADGGDGDGDDGDGDGHDGEK